MGPKVKFTREQIVDAAFEIARTEGMDSISMRKIAERMSSSVAPIYANFENVDELHQALFEKIMGISRQLLTEENTG
ncbi:MAG: TetR/AcrR family transcriptional regulator, partial [Bacteroidales bacterium]|nr:TetR/AcrR family transcriptional regulator [Bacteroidales bacterium]